MLLSRFMVGMLWLGLMGAGAGAGAGVVSGQNYPNKTIRIVTAPAGGGSDFMARKIAQGISGPLGQPVIIDNRPTLIAYEVASKALPDGYTLLVSGAGIWIFQLMQKVAPFDTLRDFSPISQITREVSIVIVHPSVPVKSVAELITLAKAKPGELNYASGGVGFSSHLAMELFKSMAGINVVHVAYKNVPASIIALLGNESHIAIADAGLLPAHLKSGKLRGLAVTSATPSALAPGLPTVAATGLPGYEWIGMTGILAPAKTSGAIISRLNQEIVRVLNVPEVREEILNAGGEVVGSSAEQFSAMVKSEIAKVSKVIKDSGIQSN